MAIFDFIDEEEEKKKSINPDRNISISGDTLPDFIKKRYDVKNGDTTYNYRVDEWGLPQHEEPVEKYEYERQWMKDWMANRPDQWEAFARKGYAGIRYDQPENVGISLLDKIWVGDNFLPTDEEILEHNVKEELAIKDKIKETAQKEVQENIDSVKFRDHSVVDKWNDEYNIGRNYRSLYGDYDAAGVYKPGGHYIYFPRETAKSKPRVGTIAHEIAHASRMQGQSAKQGTKYVYPVNEQIAEIRGEDGRWRAGEEKGEWNWYENSNDETYSRIMDIRRTYKVDPSTIVTADMVDDWRRLDNSFSKPGRQLFEMYSNETIARMMNELVETDTKQKSILDLTQTT